MGVRAGAAGTVERNENMMGALSKPIARFGVSENLVSEH